MASVNTHDTCLSYVYVHMNSRTCLSILRKNKFSMGTPLQTLHPLAQTYISHEGLSAF